MTLTFEPDLDSIKMHQHVEHAHLGQRVKTDRRLTVIIQADKHHRPSAPCRPQRGQ